MLNALNSHAIIMIIFMPLFLHPSPTPKTGFPLTSPGILNCYRKSQPVLLHFNTVRHRLNSQGELGKLKNKNPYEENVYMNNQGIAREFCATIVCVIVVIVTIH